MPTASGLFDTLDRDLSSALSLVSTVQELRFPPGSGRAFPALPYLQLALIAELAFLRSYIAWETYLEELFVCYARGMPAADGTRFPCYLAAPNTAHLRVIIVGERRGFASWSDASQVRKRSRLYFSDGEPFVSVLDNASTSLDDMSIVRNRIAHRSGTAAKKFLDLVRARTGTIQPGVNPGRFLLARGADPSRRRLDEYLEVLRLAGRQLARR